MGIRGLYSKLQPHGEPITFNSDEEHPNYHGFVIDGPAFVFWVFQKAVVDAHTEAKATPRHTLPSYEAVVIAALEWLNRLESTALPIKHILFDGALPDHKLATRMQRVQDIVNKTRALRSRAPGFEIDLRPSSKKGVRLQHVTASHSSSLIPPFIVTAVLESLLDSKYRRRTIVLPGEADAACVSSIFCGVDDIILTGDTDLVVHSPPGSVMFLADLQDFAIEKGQSELKGIIFKPRDLMEKLGVERPLTFAFILNRDIRYELEEAASASKELDIASDLHKEAYAQFEEQYFLPNLTWSEEDPDLDGLLKKLDPRITETVFQALFAGPKPRNVRVFLPYHLEDTDRVSASLPGRDIRILGFSILATLAKQTHEYSEFDRKAEKAEVIRLDTLHDDALLEGVTRLSESLMKFKTQMFLQVGEWRLFAILHVLHWTASNNRTVQPLADIVRLAQGLQNNASWREIHFGAQVEGVLNSLRFLFQILRVRSAIQGTSAASPALYDAVDHLYQLLMALPSVSSLMPFPCAALRVDMPEPRLRAYLSDFYAKEAEAVQTTRRDRKRARRPAELPAAAPTNKRSTNIFDLLDSSST